MYVVTCSIWWSWRWVNILPTVKPDTTRVAALKDCYVMSVFEAIIEFFEPDPWRLFETMVNHVLHTRP